MSDLSEQFFLFLDLKDIDQEKLHAKLYRPYFITIDTIKKFQKQADHDIDLSIMEIIGRFLDGSEVSEKLYFKVDKKTTRLQKTVSGSMNEQGNSKSVSGS